MPDHAKLATRLVPTAILLAMISGCSSADKETEPVALVKVATVRQASIERVISTEAVLFPLQQAAITPKVSAPVKRFLVNRGDRVKAGQLLAVLENRGVAAADAGDEGASAPDVAADRAT